MRFKVLNDGRIRDLVANKNFQPRKPQNRAWAIQMADRGDAELLDILRRIDKSEIAAEAARLKTNNLTEGFNYDVWDKAKSRRMAGDSQVLNDIDTMLRLIKEDEVGDLIQKNNADIQMYKQLKSRDDRIEGSFVKAGLTPEQAKRVQYDTDAIVQGEVPAAYVPNEGAKSGGRVGNVIYPLVNGETRYHTEYELNPLTGQQDIIPFISEGVPLVTQLGVTGKVDGVNTDEFLAQRIRQLTRQDIENNNLGDNYADVDFIDKATGRKVDAELTTTDKINNEGGRIGVQAYTSIATPDTVRTRGSQIARAVKQEVLDELDAYGGNLEDAVDSLGRKGVLVNGTGQNVPRKGKVFNYDEVVYPVTTTRIAKANLKNHDITFPLEGAYEVDVSKAMDLVDGLSGLELEESLSFPNYPGFGGPTGYPVAKAYVQVPVGNKQVVRNLAETNPVVRQLFSKQ